MIPTKNAIIPAAVGVDIGMGAKSFIIKGKDNPESFCSCSHGTGRRMSRSAAKRQFTEDDDEEQTQGVECRKDKGIIDETPAAYNDIDKVMEDQSDTIDVIHTLKKLYALKVNRQHSKREKHYGKIHHNGKKSRGPIPTIT